MYHKCTVHVKDRQRNGPDTKIVKYIRGRISCKNAQAKRIGSARARQPERLSPHTSLGVGPTVLSLATTEIKKHGGALHRIS